MKNNLVESNETSNELTDEEKDKKITRSEILSNSIYKSYIDDELLESKHVVFLYFFEKSFGNIAFSCRAVHIHRQTYYNWIDSNATFKQIVEDIKDEKIDIVEDKLFNNILKGNVIAQMFYLKTIGRKRGYQENIQVENSYDIEGFEFINVNE